MTSDPLYDPVGQTRRPAPPRRRSGSVGVAAVVVILLGPAIAASAMRRQESAADAVAVAAIEVAPRPPAPPVGPAAAPVTPAPSAQVISTGGADQGSGDTVEFQNGVKIIRLGAARSSASIAIPVPGAAAAARLKPAPDARVVERSRFGDLPRLGPNGLRPSEAYAGAVATPPELAGAPKIALMIADMGIDQMATAEAARRLPAAVTFAFPPGSPDLPAQTAETRRAGHETVLQLAAAPVLAPGLADADMLDRLHGMMGRFSGYAGVAVVDGAGVPADAAALPALRDIAARGLYVVDDGSLPQGSLRSLEATLGLAAADNVVIVDAAQGGDGVAAALGRLADTARTTGAAVGIVRRPRAGLETLVGFTASLTAKGLALVPVGTLAASAPAAQATR